MNMVLPRLGRDSAIEMVDRHRRTPLDGYCCRDARPHAHRHIFAGWRRES